eukprot:gb/GEZN01004168.1/.p1 GENE.gb/GEZN01004168.1/~~gb/GEZN01004168.1/.p1  ORF type:complete len:503 (-),score=34.74 gb/GEZN01004168.1/:410-1918(-)
MSNSDKKQRLDSAVSPPRQQSLILPIFFYNDLAPVGTMMQMHLFEPRYRLMIDRITKDQDARMPGACRFLYLPSHSYATQFGSIGVITVVRRCEKFADGRANVVLEMEDYGLVNAHWIEPNSANLSYARVQVIGKNLPLHLDTTLSVLCVATDNRYEVCSSEQGYIGVYRNPRLEGGANVQGQIADRTVVTAIEHQGEWIRHSRGWSLRTLEGRVFMLPASRSRAAQVGEETGTRLIIGPEQLEGQRHMVSLASPSEAKSVQEKMKKLLPRDTLPSYFHVDTPAGPLVCCKDLVEKIREIAKDLIVSVPGGTIAELKKYAKSLDITFKHVVDKDDLILQLDMGLRLRSVSDCLNTSLKGLTTQLVLGMPLHEGTVGSALYAPAATGISTLMWDEQRRINVASYLKHEFAYETDAAVGFWDSKELVNDYVLLQVLVGSSKFITPSSATHVSRADASRVLLNCSKRINWDRARLLWLGERTSSRSLFRTLDPFLIELIASFLKY